MKNPFSIRRFQVSDAESIHQVAKASWHYTYRNIYTEDEINDRINTWYDIDGLKTIPKYMGKGLTELLVLINTQLDDIIGFSQMGFDQFWKHSTKPTTPIWLQRIYLHPDVIGNELGNQLLNRAEQFVVSHNRSNYLVNVHKENSIALKFYSKMGFKHINEEEEDIILRKDLH